MRVVFDSNILVSGLVFPGKQAEKALLRIIDGRDRLLVSKPIIDELLSVLARKFARDLEALARTAVLIEELGEMIRPKRRIHMLKDEPDNRILECAVCKRQQMGAGAHWRLRRFALRLARSQPGFSVGWGARSAAPFFFLPRGFGLRMPQSVRIGESLIPAAMTIRISHRLFCAGNGYCTRPALPDRAYMNGGLSSHQLPTKAIAHRPFFPVCDVRYRQLRTFHWVHPGSE